MKHVYLYLDRWSNSKNTAQLGWFNHHLHNMRWSTFSFWRHLHAKPKNSKHRNLHQVFSTRESKSQNTQLSPSIFWWKFRGTPLFDVLFPGRGFGGTSGWVPWTKFPMMHLFTVRVFILFRLLHPGFHGWTKASLKQRQCFFFQGETAQSRTSLISLGARVGRRTFTASLPGGCAGGCALALPETNIAPQKSMVRRWNLFWDGHFSGDILVAGSVNITPPQVWTILFGAL